MDSFSFVDGIIRDYFDITVPGSLTIVGRRKRCARIICSGAMTVTYLGNTYQLTAGENLITTSLLEANMPTFGGSGRMVDYNMPDYRTHENEGWNPEQTAMSGTTG